MRAILTSIGPTPAANAAGRPILTPELNASVAARRSRTPDTLEEILSKVEGMDPDRAVDSVFKHIDYGHQSIADMVPVSIHFEGVSLWLIEYVWTLVHVGGGQESSTRYIDYTTMGYVQPDQLGLSRDEFGDYHSMVQDGFRAYKAAFQAWTSIAENEPGLVKIPEGASAAVVKRFQNNFVCDRARYWLPIAALNNANVTTWAREWAEICRTLLSHPIAEAKQLGALLRDELALAAPRLLKHIQYRTEYYDLFMDEFGELVEMTQQTEIGFNEQMEALEFCHEPLAFFRVHTRHMDERLGHNFRESTLRRSLRHHKNRYDPIGTPMRKTSVEYGWDGVANAEIRDMNRHRPGEKDLLLLPFGFYSAEDQFPRYNSTDEEEKVLASLVATGVTSVRKTRERLGQGRPDFIYWSNLGTQFHFSHTSTMNKLVYENELRTGRGVHFRYRAHYEQLLELIYEEYPTLRGVILQGSGEPE